MSLWKLITARWGSGAGEVDEVRIDASTNSLQIVDYAHHEIHGGSHYYVKSYDELGSTDTVEFVITIPNTTTWAHLLFSLESTGETQIDIYEGASGVSGGTTVTPINNNRNSVSTSVLTIVKDPTSITSDGTLISASLVGIASTPSKTLGGEVGREDEIILKQNETYLIRVTSNSNDNNVDYKANWYEHADKH